jgi:hypothetical protein
MTMKKNMTMTTNPERKLTVNPASFLAESEWKSSLLRKPELVRSDIFIQGLTPDEVEMIREALGKGLTPNGFEVVEDTLILRFDRPLKPPPV